MELCVGDVGADGGDGVWGDAEALLGVGVPEEAVLCAGGVAGGDVVRGAGKVLEVVREGRGDVARLVLPEAHLVDDVLGDDVVPRVALRVRVDVQKLRDLLARDAAREGAPHALAAERADKEAAARQRVALVAEELQQRLLQRRQPVAVHVPVRLHNHFSP